MRHKHFIVKNTFLHVGLMTVILVISRPFSSKITKRIWHGWHPPSWIFNFKRMYGKNMVTWYQCCALIGYRPNGRAYYWYKSLDGGVPLAHWNPYTKLDHDQLDFATLFLTRHQNDLPYRKLAIFHLETLVSLANSKALLLWLLHTNS